MIQLYQKVTQLQVLKHFFDNPTEKFYLRELGRLLNISPMTVKRALDILLNDDLIVKEERKNQILYRANIESPAFRFAKVAYNLAWLEESGIVAYLVDNNSGISSIILFGSFAKGENDNYSDLDIFVISTKKTIQDPGISKKLDIKVNIMNFNTEQWTKQAQNNRAFYLDIITEGIVLYGTRPVIE